MYVTELRNHRHYRILCKGCYSETVILLPPISEFQGPAAQYCSRCGQVGALLEIRPIPDRSNWAAIAEDLGLDPEAGEALIKMLYESWAPTAEEGHSFRTWVRGELVELGLLE